MRSRSRSGSVAGSLDIQFRYRSRSIKAFSAQTTVSAALREAVQLIALANRHEQSFKSARFEARNRVSRRSFSKLPFSLRRPSGGRRRTKRRLPGTSTHAAWHRTTPIQQAPTPEYVSAVPAPKRAASPQAMASPCVSAKTPVFTCGFLLGLRS